MKSQSLKLISNLDFFTKEALRQLETDKEALNFNIKNWLKNGKIISLKKGLYLLAERWEKEADKESYSEFLANKIYEPSYLSMEYVMSKYGLLTEAVYGLSSVTTKKTKVFKNRVGLFSYSSITPGLFTGFKIENGARIKVVASKAKAVFDYLYFRFLKETPINQKEILELRINWENLSQKEWVEVEKYIRKTRSQRLEKMTEIIRKQYYA